MLFPRGNCVRGWTRRTAASALTVTRTFVSTGPLPVDSPQRATDLGRGHTGDLSPKASSGVLGLTMAASRFRIGRVPVDAVTLSGAIDRIVELVRSRRGGTVYTPNVDHVVVAEEDPAFRSAYAEVSLSLVDGTPVLWAARLLGFGVPEKVSGSDLFEPLIERAARGSLPIFLVGGQPGVAERARDRLQARYPGLSVVGIRSPRIDGGGHAEDEDDLVAEIRVAEPALVFVACGAPKSELFSHRNRARLRPSVLVCVGAAIDFAAGTARRAPRWVSRVGLEWLYRLVREPRRLARRYLLRDPKFFWIFGKQVLATWGGALRARLPAPARRSVPALPEDRIMPRSEVRPLPGTTADEALAESGVVDTTGTERDERSLP